MRRFGILFLLSLVADAQVGQRQLLAALPVGGTTKAWTHAQATAMADNTSATTCVGVLTNNPGTGHNVVAVVMWFNGTNTPPASITVADGNSNSYTKAVHSPSSTHADGAGHIYIFHLDNAPANASKTVTATFSSGSACSILIDDFTVSNGTAAYDQDAVGAGVAAAVSSANGGPTIGVTAAGEMAYCGVGPQSQVNSVDTPWTQGAITSANGVASGYITNLAASQDLKATLSSSQDFDAACASFK